MGHEGVDLSELYMDKNKFEMAIANGRWVATVHNMPICLGYFGAAVAR